MCCRCNRFSYFPSSGNLNTDISVEAHIDFLRSLYCISSKLITSAHFLVKLDNSKKFDWVWGGGGGCPALFSAAPPMSAATVVFVAAVNDIRSAILTVGAYVLNPGFVLSTPVCGAGTPCATRKFYEEGRYSSIVVPWLYY